MASTVVVVIGSVVVAMLAVVTLDIVEEVLGVWQGEDVLTGLDVGATAVLLVLDDMKSEVDELEGTTYAILVVVELGTDTTELEVELVVNDGLAGGVEVTMEVCGEVHEVDSDGA